MKHLTLAALSIALAAAGASAQTFHWLPSGHDVLEGNSNNTIPFWSVSATYQQIHDSSDCDIAFGGPVATLNSINFRKDGTLSSSVPAKTFDLQITLGQTPVTAATYTTAFATNLGPTPQVVLPYTTVSLPSLTNSSVPNPIGWNIPFTAPFTYISAVGNLCWEFRLMNGAAGSAPMDSVSRTSSTTLPNLGTGCIATGQTLAAAIGLKSLSMSTGAWRNRLDRGMASAPAVQLIGFAPTPLPLPGFCSQLEFFPVTSITGTTGATGTWDSTLTFGSLLDAPALDILAQFAWIDGGLPNGVGLSNATQLRIPADSIRNSCRVYASPSGGGAGNELATVATGSSARIGLVTIFGQ